ncbi:acyl-CoA dehydrogenase family protein [Natrarchaeobius sp. A-rgal3]|uniref:acyl-CoA dehydrogenase family protein n=1 Tax=Natrarchaeobius versutus TaxID=1679078 RepID=UPI003510B84B
MDARLTDEHVQVQETTREFLEGHDGIELARRMGDGDDGVVDEVWSSMAELDFTTITVPFEYGGFGEGLLYLSVLLEELGRYATPGPFPETLAFCVPLIEALGDDDQREQQLSAVVEDDRKLSFALYDDRTDHLPSAIRMDAEPVDDGYRLSGRKTLVPYAGDADRLVVVARTGDGEGFDGLSAFVVDPSAAAVDVEVLDSLDRTRPMYDVAFDDLVVGEDAVLGDAGVAGQAVERAIDRYTTAACIMLTGGADRTVELSTQQGTQRTQYGKPVGHFQAVKHRIAEMWIDTEHARSLAYRAAWALDDPETSGDDAALAVSSAKAFVGENVHRVFGDDIWNQGGMGYTWEHDTHIYLKQATAWREFLGSPEYHLDRIAELRDYESSPLPGYPELE